MKGKQGMNKVVLFALCAVAFGMAFGKDVLPKGWQGYVKARRVCVSRDTETLPGYVITTWQRDGKPDWILPSVEKNAAKKDAKNLEKAIKDLKDVRDKSSETMRELYDSILATLNQVPEA